MSDINVQDLMDFLKTEVDVNTIGEADDKEQTLKICPSCNKEYIPQEGVDLDNKCPLCGIALDGEGQEVEVLGDKDLGVPTVESKLKEAINKDDGEQKKIDKLEEKGKMELRVVVPSEAEDDVDFWLVDKMGFEVGTASRSGPHSYLGMGKSVEDMKNKIKTKFGKSVAGKIEVFDVNESKLKEMSRWTRAAGTDEQEQAIAKLERSLKELGRRIVGGTTVGKAPQGVILDLTHQGGEIYIGREGNVKIHSVEVDPGDPRSIEDALEESKLKDKCSDKTTKQKQAIFFQKQRDKKKKESKTTEVVATYPVTYKESLEVIENEIYRLISENDPVVVDIDNIKETAKAVYYWIKNAKPELLEQPEEIRRNTVLLKTAIRKAEVSKPVGVQDSKLYQCMSCAKVFKGVKATCPECKESKEIEVLGEKTKVKEQDADSNELKVSVLKSRISWNMYGKPYADLTVEEAEIVDRELNKKEESKLKEHLNDDGSGDTEDIDDVRPVGKKQNPKTKKKFKEFKIKKEVRQDFVDKCVKVFKAPGGTVQQKIEFMKKKGATDAEITQALDTASGGELVKTALGDSKTKEQDDNIFVAISNETKESELKENEYTDFSEEQLISGYNTLMKMADSGKVFPKESTAEIVKIFAEIKKRGLENKVLNKESKLKEQEKEEFQKGREYARVTKEAHLNLKTVLNMIKPHSSEEFRRGYTSYLEKSSEEESKLKEQDDKDNYEPIAKGIKDKNTADRIARENEGSVVIEDEEDNKKFSVIIKKEER